MYRLDTYDVVMSRHQDYRAEVTRDHLAALARASEPQVPTPTRRVFLSSVRNAVSVVFSHSIALNSN
jgi:hypothetical protein